MSALLIGYDLYRGDQQDYEDLFKVLKSEGTYWHNLDSTWIVVTSKSPKEMRDEINGHVDPKDKVLVIDISDRAAAWRGFTTKAGDWIKKNTKTV